MFPYLSPLHIFLYVMASHHETFITQVMCVYIFSLLSIENLPKKTLSVTKPYRLQVAYKVQY